MDELDEIKHLAGVTEKSADVGMNMSLTGTEKARIQRERNIKPGTPEFFRLWFALPYLTGEKPID